MPRLVSVLAAVVTLAATGGSALADSTFRFQDDAGVVHYTNVPSDPRYGFVRRDPELAQPARPAAAQPGGTLGRGLRAFAHVIRDAAQRHGVDARLVEAIVQTESAGNPTAVSPKGARGLMQLMPERAAELGVRDSFDPVQNVDGGVRHMRDLLQRFGGDVTLALAAYNAGEAAVRTHGGVPPYTETREYVRRVRALYDGATRAIPSAVALVTAPQRIYRAVAEDGTLTFTNVPPRAGSSARRL
jgi:soluble lytic murein transglycosylase